MLNNADDVYDVAVIGSGPAGSSAVISAGSEGLKVIWIDSKNALGGQVIDSVSIQNYPGFPDGITGKDLMALFMEQAAKFNPKILRPVRALSLRQSDGLHIIDTDDIEIPVIRSKTIILATDLSYRRLGAEGISSFLGRGVTYGMPDIKDPQADHCFCIVGGANSAGQAAVGLASSYAACKVVMIVRKDNLEETMSHYLCDDIAQLPNIEIRFNSEIIKISGNSHIQSMVVRTNGSNETVTLPVQSLCIFIGAAPKIEWLKGIVEVSPKGFICTGRDLTTWKPAGRQPFNSETSIPGVFACGDVVEGSIKRIVAAIYGGAHAVNDIHKYLGLMKKNPK